MAFGILNDIAITAKLYKALSTDTKPTNIEGGSKCFETDTLDLYEFDGAAWIKIRGTDSSGNPAWVVMNGNITSWAGSGTGNAPTPSASTRVYGFDLDGIITAQMYFWDGDSWATLTGVTHDVFLGL